MAWREYPVIDGDGHIVEPVDLWDRYLDPAYKDRAPEIVRIETGEELVFVDGQQAIRGGVGLQTIGLPNWDWRKQPMAELSYATDMRPGGFDPHARIQDMDIDGIDVAVLYPSIGLFFGHLEDRGLIAAICRAYNDWLADYCKPHPDRLKGVAMVPLQYVDDAVAEARRAVTELDFKAVFIRPNPYRGRNLNHPDYEPFWAEMERLGVPVAVHEASQSMMPTMGADRFEDNLYFEHMISHVFEQKVACMTIVSGGILERYPKLKAVFLESGVGWLPHWLQRMDEYYEEWDYMVPWLKAKPSEYFARQCFISCDADELILPAVVDIVGEDNIIFNSDYPHHDCTFPGAVAALTDRTDLSERVKRKILGDNAQRLYGI